MIATSEITQLAVSRWTYHKSCLKQSGHAASGCLARTPQRPGLSPWLGPRSAVYQPTRSLMKYKNSSVGLVCAEQEQTEQTMASGNNGVAEQTGTNGLIPS